MKHSRSIINYNQRILVNKSRRDIQEICISIGFVAPTTILLIVFVLFSIIWTIRISLNKWDGIMPIMNFVGLNNYLTMFKLPQFQRALINNFIWTIMFLVFACGTGFLLAFLISRLSRGIAFFRTVLFLPNIIALTLAAIMWAQIYNPSYGILNRFLITMGLDFLARQWLAEPSIAIYAIAMTNCWHAYGYYMVLFLAGLQGIDASLYEAAIIDGANDRQQFIHVTIPGLRNVLTFVLSMALINGLKGFAAVWAMTQGGPEYATNLISLFVYKKAFLENDYGVASSAAVVLGIMIMALTILFNIIRERLNKD
jgi:raffinose/stachyose/melibiose transport system permease protein